MRFANKAHGVSADGELLLNENRKVTVRCPHPAASYEEYVQDLRICSRQA